MSRIDLTRIAETDHDKLLDDMTVAPISFYHIMINAKFKLVYDLESLFVFGCTTVQ